MEHITNSVTFWTTLDKIAATSAVIIDRPAGSHHPKYPWYVYPVDYGYLEGTSSMDGNCIDVWRGTHGSDIDAIICTIDWLKKDSEIKVLIGCGEEEKKLIWESHNNSDYMKGILIRRHVPTQANTGKKRGRDRKRATEQNPQARRPLHR